VHLCALLHVLVHTAKHVGLCQPLDEMLVSVNTVNSCFLSMFGAVKQQLVLETAGSFRQLTFLDNNVGSLNMLQTRTIAMTCRYNRLYTVTGQCKESELSEYKGTLQSVLQSFAPPALPPY